MCCTHVVRIAYAIGMNFALYRFLHASCKHCGRLVARMCVHSRRMVRTLCVFWRDLVKFQDWRTPIDFFGFFFIFWAGVVGEGGDARTCVNVREEDSRLRRFGVNLREQWNSHFRL